MIVKHTGGGRFDPDEDPISFVVVAASNMVMASQGIATHILAAVDILESQSALQMLADVLDADPPIRVLLDSGTHSLVQGYARAHAIPSGQARLVAPDKIDGFDALKTRYYTILDQFADRLWGYIELDIGGVDSKRRLRLETESRGFFPIPVYHPLVDGWDYFDELASGYDRVCIGNTAHEPAFVRKRILVTIDARRRAYPGLRWTHALGVRPNEWLRGLNFNSVDSSSWTQPVRFGTFPAFSDGKRFSQLPNTINYVYGETAWDTGIDKINRLAMISAHQEQVAWRTRLRHFPSTS